MKRARRGVSDLGKLPSCPAFQQGFSGVPADAGFDAAALSGGEIMQAREKRIRRYPRPPAEALRPVYLFGSRLLPFLPLPMLLSVSYGDRQQQPSALLGFFPCC